MKRGINIFKGEEDLKEKATLAGIHIDGKQKWVYTRPIGYSSFWHSLKCAWLVFREKADIVIWKYQ